MMLWTQLPEHRYTQEQIDQIRQYTAGRFGIRLVDKNRSDSFYSSPGSDVITRAADGQQASLSEMDSEEIFQSILEQLRLDQNVPLFFDRQYGLFRGIFPWSKWSIIDQYMYVTQVAWKYFCDQKRDPIDFVLMASTPHGLDNYVRARVREWMGVRILILGRTLLDNYDRIYLGLGRDRVAVPLTAKVDDSKAAEYKDRVEKKLQLLTSTYDRAIPSYERKRLERNRGRIFSLRHLLLTKFWRPAWLLNTVFCWRVMNRLSKAFEGVSQRKYVVVFLQYQPERTSLPEAWGFTQQYDAVHAIRRATPSEVMVLVREHPSTFSNQCHPRWRSPKFYRAIANIPGVAFVDIHADPFSIVDRASCVATLTGTVGAEAAARGRPALFLGVSMLRPSYGVHVYRDFADMASFLRKACEGEFASVAIQEGLARSLLEDERFVFEVTEKMQFKENVNATVDAFKVLANSPEALSMLSNGPKKYCCPGSSLECNLGP